MTIKHLMKLVLFSTLTIPAFAQSTSPDISLAQASYHWQVVQANQAYCQGLDATNYTPLFTEKRKHWEIAIKRQYFLSQSMMKVMTQNQVTRFANLSELNAAKLNYSDAELSQMELPAGWQEFKSDQPLLAQIEKRLHASSMDSKHAACDAALKKAGVPSLLALPE